MSMQFGIGERAPRRPEVSRQVCMPSAFARLEDAVVNCVLHHRFAPGDREPPLEIFSTSTYLPISRIISPA